MKRLTMGILAHVDAGKTTLSEALLYKTENIRRFGRVDNQDTFLDTNEMERARGITIFAKQAILSWQDTIITLLDTPGHVDFSAEMERTLQVLDYAVLLISGADGVQAHTRTLWRLLKKYKIPVFIFINKMDQPGTSRNQLLAAIKTELNENCVDFSDDVAIDAAAGSGAEALAERQEAIAMCSEAALEQYLADGKVSDDQIRSMIKQRTLFPCYFGSALKLQGVETLIEGIVENTIHPDHNATFGARVFKISRDQQGNRLTHMKITGGQLAVKAVLTEAQDKVNQIRIYSGDKYETVTEASAGQVCAVTGLTTTFPGQGLGDETEVIIPVLEPVLTYQIRLPEEQDAVSLIPKLRQLEEEEPELRIEWEEQTQEIRAQIMGDVQLEILTRTIQDRFGVSVSFGTGSIVFKETIANQVEGVGHFEPLRHYAEVHLLLEPGEPGSGMQYAASCSEDILDRNWQRLILTHLAEKEHRGVLTGSPITDMRITLVSGRAHQKHTEGGDFRQATYRAVRQGLKQADSILLEPWFNFRLEIPTALIGRAMTDIEQMKGTFQVPETNGDQAILTGTVPVITAANYQKEVVAYSKGEGHWQTTLKGYLPCHNAEEVMTAARYDSELDLDNPTGSVFCSHGAGYTVSWDLVPDYMHLESTLTSTSHQPKEPETKYPVKRTTTERSIGTDEIDAILARTTGANKKDNRRGKSPIAMGDVPRNKWSRPKAPTPVYQTTRTYHPQEKKEEYLLVDGYNIIYSWEELNQLSRTNMDAARGRLMDILCNYQGIKKHHLILVFDAYRVAGHITETVDYQNIHVVYTKEAETADEYIERFAHDHNKNYNITVATSDGLEQIIIRSQGCRLLSASDLEEEVNRTIKQFREDYLEPQKTPRSLIGEKIPDDWQEVTPPEEPKE